ncbi:kinase-like protein [Rickenella mellea]|uniref:Kinase-like protein n=1 Tax=Rickenella mellea TaxID=50990 RepID=A0A4Y7Q265_9AGAM|nr:kinase-like protein [Rickenella mellea]
MDMDTEPTTSDSFVRQYGHLWGFFIPCNSENPQIDFSIHCLDVSFGRGPECDYRLEDRKISSIHCRLRWDGQEAWDSMATITDLSTNGTFINGKKIGTNQTCILRDGDEVAFSSWEHCDGAEDHRYIFRFTACGLPRDGLYKFYDIADRLGAGAFTTVVRAISRETGATYAVKMIRRSRCKYNDTIGNNVFIRKIDIFKGLHHKNICQLKEMFVDVNSIYLVLEYVDGGNLYDYMTKLKGHSLSRQDLWAGVQAQIDEEKTRLVTRQICQALAYIHSQGIAHRNLTPENILVTKDDPPVVKLANFGLPKVVDSETFFRTPIYIAPDDLLSGAATQGHDHLVDSWSVGVIVFKMLTGVSPFEDSEVVPIHIRIRRLKVVWDRLLNIPHSIEALSFVARLLIFEPRARMSPTQALSHIWIRPSDTALPRDAIVPEDNWSTFSYAPTGSLELAPMRSINENSVVDDVRQHQRQDGHMDVAVEQGFKNLSI